MITITVKIWEYHSLHIQDPQSILQTKMWVIHTPWKFEMGTTSSDGLVATSSASWSMMGNEVVGSDVTLLTLKWVMNLEREMIFMWIQTWHTSPYKLVYSIYICSANIKMFLYELENPRQQMNMQFIIVDYLLAAISISTYQVNGNIIHLVS